MADWAAKTLMVGAGGFLGANLRYWLGGWIQGLAGAGFPWGTVAVNLTGSLVIGLFMGLFTQLDWNPNWRLFVALGVLGGYTTYSTFAYEALRLFAERRWWAGLAYVEATAVGAVGAAWLGLVLARAILGGRA